MERPYTSVTVTPKAEKALRAGHPWVYGEEVTAVRGEYTNGDIVDVFSAKGKWLGSGFVNDRSKIRVRLLTRDVNAKFDEAFWERRLRYAVEYRRTVMGDDFDNCRLVFGEADGLPGLTVDRFGEILVTEALCLGIELRKDLLYRKLIGILAENGVRIRSLFERSDSKIRELEGLPPEKGFRLAGGLSEDPDGKTEIRENGIVFLVDYVNGQKTGFFLDQKYNRKAVAKIAEGKRVLDCFTHTGAFALNAAKAGAESVTAVDVSEEALSAAAENAKRNGLQDRVTFVRADVFDFLSEAVKRGGHPYDLIILDPPAFTKSGKTVRNAFAGYKEINYRAMKLLPRGGYLATCSCSHFMTEPLFRGMLAEAARDADVQLRQIEARRQSPDHPILWNVPETDYLKFYLFQVV